MTPPRLLGWLAYLIPSSHREESIGDLLELWHEERAVATRGGGPDRRLLARTVRAGLESRAIGVMETMRSLREGEGMKNGWGGDLVAAARMLRRNRAAAWTAVLTLSLGVWAFVAGYALLDRALLQPLGYPGEDRLVVVGLGERALFGVSYPAHEELAARNPVMEDAAAWQLWGLLHRPEAGPWARVTAASASASYLDMLGAEPLLGTLFRPEDEVPGHEPVVVLSHDSWKRRFGARPDIVGERLDLDGERYTVLGVLSPDFVDPLPRLYGWSAPELWRATPPSFDAAVNGPGQVSFWSLARLRDGVPFEEARAAVEARARELYGTEGIEDLTIRSYEGLVGRRSSSSILMLLGAGALVLLVALANVTNLLLASGTGRTKEMSVRASLGAPRSRLVRLLLVEGGALGSVGGVLGSLLALSTIGQVERLSVGLLPPGTTLALDGRVVAVALVTAVSVGVLAALLPAFVTTRSAGLATLREGRGSGRRRTPLQAGLVVAQATLAVTLVASSGLLLRSLWTLGARSPGFEPAGVTTVRVSFMPELFGGDEEQTATVEAVGARVAALPGVERVSGITDLPLSGAVNSTVVERPDLPGDDAAASVTTLVRGVLPGFADAMRIPLVEGRFIGETDRAGTESVAVVNRAYASRAFAGESALGRVVSVRGVERTIVGVLEDVHEFDLVEGADPVLYEPYAQVEPAWMRAALTLVVRASSEVDAGALRRAADEVDTRLPLATPRPMSAYVDRVLAAPRFRAYVAAVFGALALLLAAIGVGGVTAYDVGTRTRELGVRVALGASRSRVASAVVASVGVLIAAGVGLGVGGAALTGHALAGFLFEVTPFDPLTLFVAVSSLCTAAGASVLVPLRRALAVDPVDAFREE